MWRSCQYWSPGAGAPVTVQLLFLPARVLEPCTYSVLCTVWSCMCRGLLPCDSFHATPACGAISNIAIGASRKSIVASWAVCRTDKPSCPLPMINLPIAAARYGPVILGHSISAQLIVSISIVLHRSLHRGTSCPGEDPYLPSLSRLREKGKRKKKQHQKSLKGHKNYSTLQRCMAGRRYGT